MRNELIINYNLLIYFIINYKFYSTVGILKYELEKELMDLNILLEINKNKIEEKYKGLYVSRLDRFTSKIKESEDC